MHSAKWCAVILLGSLFSPRCLVSFLVEVMSYEYWLNYNCVCMPIYTVAIQLYNRNISCDCFISLFDVQVECHPVQCDYLVYYLVPGTTGGHIPNSELLLPHHHSLA